MAVKTTPPGWATDAVRPLVEDLRQRALSGLTHAESLRVSSDEFVARPGGVRDRLFQDVPREKRTPSGRLHVSPLDIVHMELQRLPAQVEHLTALLETSQGGRPGPLRED